jgi:RNA polymerase sigma-70 factor (ECF subfamily)
MTPASEEQTALKPFEDTVLVHLDAAYNLARWLTRDDAAANDAVQEACLRAYRFFGAQDGPNVKAWFLAIVRNVCLDALAARRATPQHETYDDEMHSDALSPGAIESPESAATRTSDARWVRECIATLPPEYREVIVLRELEELSYKEIGAIVEVPLGTVMSRLARARDLLQQRLTATRRWRDA